MTSLNSVRHCEVGGLPLFLGGAHDILNDRAVQVTDRIKCKLSGREFIPDESISVEDQVDRLVIEATSHANLCQAYIGWCPFW